MRFEYKLNNIDNIAKELINSFKNKIVLFNGDMGSG
jgi:tRNA A37 threonylcarbamoyladenosine biosynthesis protein TsaE